MVGSFSQGHSIRSRSLTDDILYPRSSAVTVCMGRDVRQKRAEMLAFCFLALWLFTVQFAKAQSHSRANTTLRIEVNVVLTVVPTSAAAQAQNFFDTVNPSNGLVAVWASRFSNHCAQSPEVRSFFSSGWRPENPGRTDLGAGLEPLLITNVTVPE